MTVNEILNKYSWPLRTLEPLTSIAEIEAFIHFKLPGDYKSFIKEYTGSETNIGNQYISLWDADKIIELNKSYSITEYLPLTLGIGDNGAGEFIAIEMVDSSRYRIVLSPLIDLDQQNHIEIGNSFSDYLFRLDNGREWFENI